jgi:flagellar L-ring protein precursor FlgH
MNKKTWMLAFLLLVFGAVIPPLCLEAASLWNDNTNWIADRRPTKVGDIVTVVVDEKTKTKDQGKTNVSKTNDSSIADGAGILDFIKAFGFKSSSKMTGDGSSERTYTASARITCLVTDVLPNGNLIIEGTRDIATHDETLQLAIIGVIRPQDVDSYNRIRSDLVANAEINVRGKGAITRLQKPGILTQILQAIF